MTQSEEKSLIFDTSAIVRIIKKDRNYQTVLNLLQKSAESKSGFISALTTFETCLVTSRLSQHKANETISYLEASNLQFKPVTHEIAKKAILLKLNYHNLNISMADAIIIQTGIEENAEIITADKEWLNVKEAKVKIV